MYNCGLRPQPASLFTTIQSHLSWTYSDQATGRTGESGFDSSCGERKYSFFPKRTSWLSIAYFPPQLIPWALSPGITRPGRETDHSPSSSAKLMIARCYTSITLHAFKTSYLKVPSPVTTARQFFWSRNTVFHTCVHTYGPYLELRVQ